MPTRPKVGPADIVAISNGWVDDVLFIWAITRSKSFVSARDSEVQVGVVWAHERYVQPSPTQDCCNQLARRAKSGITVTCQCSQLTIPVLMPPRA